MQAQIAFSNEGLLGFEVSLFVHDAPDRATVLTIMQEFLSDFLLYDPDCSLGSKGHREHGQTREKRKRFAVCRRTGGKFHAGDTMPDTAAARPAVPCRFHRITKRRWLGRREPD
jgi:hypothetical protein